MSKVNFELSDYLKEVLGQTLGWSISKKLKELSLEYATWKILDDAVFGRAGDIMSDFLSILTVSGKEQLLSDVWREVEQAVVRNAKEDEYFTSGEDMLAVSKSLSDAFARATRTAILVFERNGDNLCLEVEDLFLAIAYNPGDNKIGDILEDYKLTRERLLSIIQPSLISSYPSFTSSNSTRKEKRVESEGSGPEKAEEISEPMQKAMDDFEMAGERDGINSKAVDPESTTPYLDLYSYDMSAAAKAKKFDPVVGRDKEIEQIIEVLCCRKKNNVVLLGDPGCGKTAIIECLAQRINAEKVPAPLKGKRICSLDLNALVSGTKYRGEYEQRLQGIIKEVVTHPEIIVYIDEFHNLVGNGSSEGKGDGANILKPYLARGEFQCIGSTTVDEYRKFVEKDGALKRRFQNLIISEPTISETIKILETLSGKYSNFHNVKYPSEVLKACGEWAGRYIPDRFFPDKAIDVLDMAGSLRKLASPSSGSLLETKLNQLKALEEKMIETALSGDFKAANDIRKQRATLEKEIDKIKSGGVSEKEKKAWPEVTLANVASVVSKISNVPVDKIQGSDMDKLRGMKEALEKKVIGQEEAVKKITISIQRNFLGLRDTSKPIASLLMVGPTGTGKTLICKEMAKEFFGSEKALIKFDMAEFSEHHEITKLTGSTASYVGYDDSPLLEQVRRQPYSVVLFDEIEKAAPEIFNIFLSILDEGNVTLGNGTKVDFKNCIIVFTGNIGTKELGLVGKGVGFGDASEEDKKKSREKIVMKAVETEFKPEFINRLSSITVFNALGKPELGKIFELELTKVKSRLKASGYSLTVGKKVKELCVSECDLKYGARDLQRAITRNIEDVICNSLLESSPTPGASKITLDLNESGAPVVEFLKPTPRKKKDSKALSVEDPAPTPTEKPTPTPA